MSTKIGNGLNLQNRPIDNVADPSSAQQAATKNYVDGALRGLDWKAEVIAASTGNVSLSAPGTALDGITLSAGMQVIAGVGTVTRVLLKDQTTSTENGVYDWNGSAAALTRSVDSATGVQLSGSTYTVQRGTVNADRVYRVASDDALTVGTTAVAFTQIGAGGTAYTGSNGVSLTGSNFAAVAAPSGGVVVSGSGIGIDTAVVARKYSITIGTGALTSIAVTHNLGTRAVHWSLMDNTTFEFILTDAVATDANTVTFTFATAPATGAYLAVIVG